MKDTPSPGIVFVGVMDWDTLQQRLHHLAQGLSRKHTVLYLNPVTYSAAAFVRDTLRGTPLRRSLLSLRRLTDTLSVADPLPLLPRALHVPAIAHLNYRLGLPFTRSAMHRLGIEQPILWLTFPSDLALVGRLGERLTIYDCMDNHPQFFAEPARSRVEEEERRLLAAVDVVFASSQGLFRKCQALNPNTHLVRNAVDAALFATRAASAPDPRGSHTPVLGYVGTIDRWLDIDLLVAVAQAYPACRVVLVGPVRAEPGALAGLPNVEIAGPRPYADIPTIIGGFDVCMIPFRLSPLTADVNPIKLYEYLLAGKPVVSTALPEVGAYREVCHIADTPQAFVAAIGTAFDEARSPAAALVAQRREIALQNTWKQRVDAIETILDQHLAMQ
jgi:glycosyltransferase involved in cell wall biosynthesis